jgi:hypothetical protein
VFSHNLDPKLTSPIASLRADSFRGLPAQAWKQTVLHQVQFGLTPSSRPRRHARLASCICSSAVENLTGKRVGKRFRFLFTFKIDPTNICARKLPETNGLELHMIEPRSHLAQLVGQFSSLYSYFSNVKHEPSSLLGAWPALIPRSLALRSFGIAVSRILRLSL